MDNPLAGHFSAAGDGKSVEAKVDWKRMVGISLAKHPKTRLAQTLR
ncbi:hypothetical protein [Novipirellula rosea]